MFISSILLHLLDLDTIYWVIFLIKKITMLACRVVCYPHQSHHCIRLYILHGSNCYIGVCIMYQSDCHIRVYILHQSYHSIWISCTNHSIWVLLSCKWCYGIRGLCTKKDINQKFWAHLMSVMIVAYARASSNEVEIYLNKVCFYFHCIILKLKHVFSTPFLTMHMPNNLHFITHCENNIQSPIRNYPIIALHEH